MQRMEIDEVRRVGPMIGLENNRIFPKSWTVEVRISGVETCFVEGTTPQRTHRFRLGAGDTENAATRPYDRENGRAIEVGSRLENWSIPGLPGATVSTGSGVNTPAEGGCVLYSSF